MSSERKIIGKGSIPEFERDGDDKDFKYMTARGTVQGGSEDIVAMPRTPDMVVYASHVSQVLRDVALQPPHLVMVPATNYFLERAIVENMEFFTSHLDRRHSYSFEPYARTPNTDLVVQSLTEMGYRVHCSYPHKVYPHEDPRSYMHRAGWSRDINHPDLPSVPRRYGLPYPISWWGTTLEDILRAYRQVAEESGSADAFFKPATSAGGFGLHRVSSEADVRGVYSRLARSDSLTLFDNPVPVEIQQQLSIKTRQSFQYYGEQIITPGILTTQIEDISTHQWRGNIFNGVVTQDDIRDTLQDFDRFRAGVYRDTRRPLSGPGGLDRVITTEGQRYYIECNAGRDTGGHAPAALAKALGISRQPFGLLKTSTPNSDLRTYWQALQKEGIAYDPSKREGALPILWIAQQGFLVSTGATEAAVMHNFDKALALAAKNGYVHP